ncbi:type II CAAX endopeptidase family protein [Nocardioides sp. SYSU D00038]|uniref:CPBP family intramembrane glutamic endopeptidase n=1 Tax=Nocardioides sp. SYSU D00038 TaxID=2812554 RepID=UPI0027DCD410|nr:type II CAAX endopeptidase family protein [Nocardioides sp. SYSU D00038]
MARVADGDYHLLQRRRPWSWWRPLLGTLLLGVLVLVVVQVVLVLVFLLGYVATGTTSAAGLEAALDRIADTGDVTPVSLAYLNLSLAAAIPVTMLVALLLHRQRPGWLASVAGRLRWRWLLVCLGLSVVALVATIVVSALVPETSDSSVSGELNDWTSTTRDFVLVVLLLTPLQAAGEEYAFRGYLTQAFGGLFGNRWVALLVPALLFALAHGAQDAPVFVDRFAFGLVAGYLVIATGGLEAGIAMHVLNNWLAFGLALAFGDMSSALNPTGGSWWSLPVTLTQSLVYLALAVAVARRMGIGNRAEPGILEPSIPRV